MGIIQKIRTKRGSTTEYIIMVTAVVATLIVFCMPGGPMVKAVSTSLNKVNGGMTDMGQRMGQSRPLSDSPDGPVGAAPVECPGCPE